MKETEQIIQQTKNWIKKVVIGCNFCPFAAREVTNNRVHYTVEWSVDVNSCLQALILECKQLDKEKTIETTLLILPKAVPKFSDYLQLLSLAEKLLKKQDYEGIYQIASFHPQYRFAGAPKKDAANYTNRSIYPMLQLLREESVEQALAHYAEPES